MAVLALSVLNALLLRDNRNLREIAREHVDALEASIGGPVPPLVGHDIYGRKITFEYGKDPRSTLLLVFSANCPFCSENWSAWNKRVHGIDPTRIRPVYVDTARDFITADFLKVRGMAGAPVLVDVDPADLLAYNLRFAGLVAWKGGLDAYATGFVATALKEPSQFIVSMVLPMSPAHRAGLLPGDELIAVQGRSVTGISPSELQDLLSSDNRPQSIKLTVTRAGSTLPLSIAFLSQPARQFANAAGVTLPDESARRTNLLLGITVLYSSSQRAAIVSEVQYPSPAFEKGIHVGDIVLNIGNTDVRQLSAWDIAHVLSPSTPTPVTIKILRLGRKLDISITPVSYQATLATIGRRLGKHGPAPLSCP